MMSFTTEVLSNHPGNYGCKGDGILLEMTLAKIEKKKKAVDLPVSTDRTATIRELSRKRKLT
jgi:hypothetical protein